VRFCRTLKGFKLRKAWLSLLVEGLLLFCLPGSSAVRSDDADASRACTGAEAAVRSTRKLLKGSILHHLRGYW